MAAAAPRPSSPVAQPGPASYYIGAGAVERAAGHAAGGQDVPAQPEAATTPERSEAQPSPRRLEAELQERSRRVGLLRAELAQEEQVCQRLQQCLGHSAASSQDKVKSPTVRGSTRRLASELAAVATPLRRGCPPRGAPVAPKGLDEWAEDDFQALFREYGLNDDGKDGCGTQQVPKVGSSAPPSPVRVLSGSTAAVSVPSPCCSLGSWASRPSTDSTSCSEPPSPQRRAASPPPPGSHALDGTLLSEEAPGGGGEAIGAPRAAASPAATWLGFRCALPKRACRVLVQVWIGGRLGPRP